MPYSYHVEIPNILRYTLIHGGEIEDNEERRISWKNVKIDQDDRLKDKRQPVFQLVVFGDYPTFLSFLRNQYWRQISRYVLGVSYFIRENISPVRIFNTNIASLYIRKIQADIVRCGAVKLVVENHTMKQKVPMSFLGRKVPITADQWSTLYTILCLEIRANPLAREGPRNRTTKTRFPNGLRWDDWFRDFIRREDVHNVLSSGDIAEMWLTDQGRRTITECIRYQAGVIAVHERQRLKKQESRNSATAEEKTAEDKSAEFDQGRHILNQASVIWDSETGDLIWPPTSA
ncbi:hypothetical protein HOY82DRAFT_646812 [Tuber indicum]|nr:hypothetical protein HOY82DRAFT_646812 [Tuber indicum]